MNMTNLWRALACGVGLLAVMSGNAFAQNGGPISWDPLRACVVLNALPDLSAAERTSLAGMIRGTTDTKVAECVLFTEPAQPGSKGEPLFSHDEEVHLIKQLSAEGAFLYLYLSEVDTAPAKIAAAVDTAVAKAEGLKERAPVAMVIDKMDKRPEYLEKLVGLTDHIGAYELLERISSILSRNAALQDGRKPVSLPNYAKYTAELKAKLLTASDVAYRLAALRLSPAIVTADEKKTIVDGLDLDALEPIHALYLETMVQRGMIMPTAAQQSAIIKAAETARR